MATARLKSVARKALAGYRRRGSIRWLCHLIISSILFRSPCGCSAGHCATSRLPWLTYFFHTTPLFCLPALHILLLRIRCLPLLYHHLLNALFCVYYGNSTSGADGAALAPPYRDHHYRLLTLARSPFLPYTSASPYRLSFAAAITPPHTVVHLPLRTSLPAAKRVTILLRGWFCRRCSSPFDGVRFGRTRGAEPFRSLTRWAFLATCCVALRDAFLP